MKHTCPCFSEVRNPRKQTWNVCATTPTGLFMAGTANQSSPVNRIWLQNPFQWCIQVAIPVGWSRQTRGHFWLFLGLRWKLMFPRRKNRLREGSIFFISLWHKSIWNSTKISFSEWFSYFLYSKEPTFIDFLLCGRFCGMKREYCQCYISFSRPPVRYSWLLPFCRR